MNVKGSAGIKVFLSETFLIISLKENIVLLNLFETSVGLDIRDSFT